MSWKTTHSQWHGWQWRNTAWHGWVDYSAQQNQTQQNVQPAQPPAQTAAVGSGAVQAAVAGSRSVGLRQVFLLEHFQQYNRYNSAKTYNAALKWFRDTLEPTGVDEYVFSNTDDEEIGEIRHNQGMQYSFNEM